MWSYFENGRNSGYCGYSMSWRAIEAYKRGLRPISGWTKSGIIESLEKEGATPEQIKAFRKVVFKDLKKIALEVVEWHHTGKYYRRTDFYGINPDCLKIDPGEILVIAKKQKSIERFLTECEQAGIDAPAIVALKYQLQDKTLEEIHAFVENYPLRIVEKAK